MKIGHQIFELNLGVNGTNVLTKFHEDQTINVASRVFTRQNVDNARRTTHDGQKAITKAHHEHVVLRAQRIDLCAAQDVIRTNVLTNFHEEFLTRFYYSHNSPPPGGHIFEQSETYCVNIQDIN
ncbi:hypothetical protein DPMN_037577 [Dreissena polymorpha]|uniref:Uncharacterized protein n=1 Tax=Dreissena polymorpha TaxID=45954 RepID=A0A9D4RPY2_DREPO|nr:hypothetical protein DPMN_037577 [Dreissena polymorpha]